MKDYRRGSTTKLILTVFTIAFTGSMASAEPTFKLTEYLKEVSLKGDLRLRQESIHRNNIHGSNTSNSSSQEDRSRQRIRLRLNLDFKFEQNVEAKFRFATGTGEQTSTNQSMDNLGSQKEFWVDRAYMQWKPIETIRLAGGKMANPFWTPYVSDVIWDTDFNPEGASESFEMFGVPRTKLFFNALQMVADEDSAGTQDQGLLSEQIGAEVLMFDQSKLTLAFGMHDWVNERAGNFGQVSQQDGNVRTSSTSAQLANDYRVLEYTGEYQSALFEIPISFQGTFIQNTQSTTTPKNDNGFQYGILVGKATKAKAWEVGAFYKRVEGDATVADIADSDFGNAGGTNRKGFISWVSYCPTEWSLLQLKYFDTKTLDPTYITHVGAGTQTAGVKPVQRYQLDLTLKF